MMLQPVECDTFFTLKGTSVTFLELTLPHVVGRFRVLPWELFECTHLEEPPVMYGFPFKSFTVCKCRKGFYRILFECGRKQVSVCLF